MATSAPPAITALPTAPDPNNRATFNTLAYPWSAALPAFSTQVSAVATNVKANADDAATSSGTATAQAAIATTQAGNASTSAATATTQAANAAASAASAAAIAGAFVGTSTSSLLIAVGSKAFTTQTGEQYTTGIWMTAVSAANSANWMFGQVTSYSGTALVLDVQAIGGSGTFADWNLSLTGARGSQGPAGTLGGTASSTVDLLTGAAIASAATINLDTATGNRVHITGGVTINAVILTRGPRTVIFDGILTLTHHATNNNLNAGGANITTAIGDRCVYESDGAVVYGRYTRASGAVVVAAAAGSTLGTPVATTSGTAINFTGIPSGTKKIDILFSGVSTNGISRKVIRIGSSAGVAVTGYSGVALSVVSGALATYEIGTSFPISSVDATHVLSGRITLNLENSTLFTWACSGISSSFGTESTFITSGSKSLSAELNNVQLTTINGTDAFDAGEVNIYYS